MDDDRRLLSDLTEEELLAGIFPLLAGEDPGVLVGPGDDTAWVAAPDGRFLATTDAVVRGSDWLDEWSSGADVGHKVVAQNVADIAAMGGVPSGLLVTVAADPATSVAWVLDLARGIGEATAAAGTVVVGGDLSGAPAGTVMVSVTAFGSTEGRQPILRSGARPGDVVAVAGSLGRSGAGWALLRDGREDEAPDLVATHRRPTPPLAEGPRAAASGAHAMIDLSDGLVRDAGRIAAASGVLIDLDEDALAPHIAALVPVVGEDEARACVLRGGEEHSLLATFSEAPSGWHVLGMVRDLLEAGVPAPGVRVGGVEQSGGGWDHFDPTR